MRYEDIQRAPRGLKILLGLVLAIAVAINVVVIVVVLQGRANIGFTDEGWFSHWGWVVPPPLLIAFMFFLFMTSRMHVWIDHEELRIRMRPFHIADRRIPWKDVESYTVRKANAFSEFGGWGIRWNPFNGKMGYIWGGQDALELTLKNGKRIVVTVSDGTKLSSCLDKIQRVTVS